MARAGDFFGVFEIMAVFAGVEWGATVAGGLEVEFLVLVVPAGLAVVGFGEIGDKHALTVVRELVVVVARKG